MIARVSGHLIEVGEGTALIENGGLTYEVLIPPASRALLAVKRGEPVTLYTLHYLEGGMNVSSPVPRLAGFLTEIEREFAQRFITVKGLGIKAVLKALIVPVHQIARAIEEKDIRTLVKLPGIGKRSAEQIVAELNGKVGMYALLRDDGAGVEPEATDVGLAAEVLTILEHLGYSAHEADTMWEKVREREFASAEDAMQEIFRQQAGAGV